MRELRISAMPPMDEQPRDSRYLSGFAHFTTGSQQQSLHHAAFQVTFRFQKASFGIITCCRHFEARAIFAIFAATDRGYRFIARLLHLELDITISLSHRAISPLYIASMGQKGQREAFRDI